MLRQFGELEQYDSPHLRISKLTDIQYQDQPYPIYAMALGSEAPDVPCLAFIGGVHGLERVGAEVVLAFMDTLVQRLSWDQSLTAGLEHLRVLFIPLVNPVGYERNTRSNGNNVDLMRNAPIDAESRAPFLLGGHRLHHRIPWYRGRKQEPMQEEARVLCDFIRQELFPAPFSLVLDCHSGFGFEDRLWFPYAYSKRPIKHLGETYALMQLLNQTYPHLNYIFEPQARHYTTHGDLWDYLYLESLDTESTFLPLTMEMGSWRWVKKNPLQLASIDGLFNPVKPHRLQRALRGHIVLMEFLIRAVRAYQNWMPDLEKSQQLRREAMELWYS
ncbi:M14 family metallopeptidase [Maricurvus nonylphenolicus]|uniref:DUF2817 domain-containing protein n=1 Tax=Maricurvus nonylphenolicus TaxID=1008307 RepID=UPI0036F43D23